MDQTLFSLINGVWTSPSLDRVMALLSDFAFWGPILVLAVLAVVVRGNFRARAAVLVILIAVGITDGGVVNSLKHWANRPRPHQVEPARVVKLARTQPKQLSIFMAPVVMTSTPETGAISGRSFPSGHTSDNFAAAAVLALFFRRWGRGYFLVAAAIGYSRIYTGSHWPSDVLISMFLGASLGLLVAVALEALWRRYGARLAPQLHLSHPSLLVP
ncbi:MAG: phosphatase PAP2 family protein [Chthoniobacteraceae bacterium]